MSTYDSHDRRLKFVCYTHLNVSGATGASRIVHIKRLEKVRFPTASVLLLLLYVIAGSFV